jgi:hypothetical protein
MNAKNYANLTDKKKEDPENRSMNFKGTVRKASTFLDLSQEHPFWHYMQH